VPLCFQAAKKAKENNMSFDKKDVKQGIDDAATHLKHAVDKVAETGEMIAAKAAAKAKEAGRKTGDRMIEQGKKLKSASR
jgi:hypothetical protein